MEHLASEPVAVPASDDNESEVSEEIALERAVFNAVSRSLAGNSVAEAVQEVEAQADRRRRFFIQNPSYKSFIKTAAG